MFRIMSSTLAEQAVNMNESEAHSRRKDIIEAIRLLNSGGTYRRSELFPLCKAPHNWQRGVITVSFVEKGYAEQVNTWTSGVPKYRGIKFIEDTPEFVTECMESAYQAYRKNRTLPPEKKMKLSDVPGSKELFSQAASEPEGPSSDLEPPAGDMPPSSAPESAEMLAALIKVIPKMVDAIQRIEQRLMKAGKKIDLIYTDLADLLHLIPSETKGKKL